MIVVDTNIIAACCEINDRKAVAQRLRALDREWHAPALWVSEFRNLILNFQKRGSLPKEYLPDLMTQARDLVPAGKTHPVADEKVLALGLRSGCTAYDCEFAALAEALDVPLLTWDKQLLGSFPGLAVTPEDFLLS